VGSKDRKWMKLVQEHAQLRLCYQQYWNLGSENRTLVVGF
jgi:hypothetical protein